MTNAVADDQGKIKPLVATFFGFSANPLCMGLGERVKRLREQRGWSQRELSRNAKLKSESHVGRVERVGIADPATIKALAEALGVTVAALDGSAPLVSSATADERYPSRAGALAIARARGYPETTLAIVESMRLKSDEDPGPKYWLDEVIRWHALEKQMPAADEAADPALDVTPRLPPRGGARR